MTDEKETLYLHPKKVIAYQCGSFWILLKKKEREVLRHPSLQDVPISSKLFSYYGYKLSLPPYSHISSLIFGRKEKKLNKQS